VDYISFAEKPQAPMFTTGLKPPFSAMLIPCSLSTTNWSLDQLTLHGHSTYDKALGSVLLAHQIREAYVPITSHFNAVILVPPAFTTHISLPGITVWRNRRQPAEGTTLEHSGEAVLFSPGGCPIIVATRGDSLVVAHAWQKSLFDSSLLAHGTPTPNRPFASVVDSILAILGATTEKLAKEVRAWVFYSIDSQKYWHSLDHPVHGAYNQRLAKQLTLSPYTVSACATVVSARVHLDLPQIISRQFTGRGVPWTQVDLGQSVLPTDDFHFPTTRNIYPEDTNRRYLVVIKRH